MAFIFGKARLAPLKQVSIPRLELCAALLAARVARTLEEELTTVVHRIILWTDSVLVLQYIRNPSRRFRTYVANRVAGIQSLTTPDQWRHVPSQLNPADDASRGLPAPELLTECRWKLGPRFLWEHEAQWPQLSTIPTHLLDSAETKRATVTLTTDTHKAETFPRRLWERYSTWTRLLRAVAILRRFLAWKVGPERGRRQSPLLTATDIDNAELCVLRAMQRECFPTELAALTSGRPISKRSPVYALEPFLDPSGAIRVGGRLRKAPLARDARDPFLLSRAHPLATVLIRETHQRVAKHMGRAHTIAALRNKFWIPRCRPLVDRILKHCVPCRRANWCAKQQRQADLSEDCVTPGQLPFTFTGLDCFGPILTRIGRRHSKRWGCLFTCLTTRAIHLEVLSCLDAPALLRAIRRFMARRGKPSVLRSDCGTNLVRVERELREAAEAWNSDGPFPAALADDRIQWRFNPPGTPHMGGAWERQIRTVKRIMQTTIGEQVLDDDRLLTLFCEVEHTVNSRPITRCLLMQGNRPPCPLRISCGAPPIRPRIPVLLTSPMPINAAGAMRSGWRIGSGNGG